MENKNLETAVYVVIGLIVVPMVIGTVAQACSSLYNAAMNLKNQNDVKYTFKTGEDEA